MLLRVFCIFVLMAQRLSSGTAKTSSKGVRRAGAVEVNCFCFLIGGRWGEAGGWLFGLRVM